ncbi:hypothetical protein [Agrobacterium tumefaciens]|uniref:hypothetical protein n=1 Tax=Agrobacterium tumefaciens TaxID=358 RepID=UPI00287E01A2|nr:hypothetical protein [Agrobacterium tumefaciens]MDS7595393.1 hypothetical protein [Agrobacterium tumefaciens]
MEVEIPLAIQILHERRKGRDILAVPYVRTTNFASPRDNGNGGDGRRRGRSYPVIVEGDRDISLKNKPDSVPVEERMSIVSNRITMPFGDSGTSHRLESQLEAGLLTLLACNPRVVRVRTQFGPLPFTHRGKLHHHYADICADFDNNCRTLYLVRAEGNLRDLKTTHELLTKQCVGKFAHRIHIYTERQINKPAVLHAEERLRARKLQNEATNQRLVEKLRMMGGTAMLFDLFSELYPAVTFADSWTAVWGLIDDNELQHDHPHAEEVIMTRLSRVTLVKASK